MDLGLRGKIAVVTASSQGIGFGAAHALGQAGAKLGLCARNETELAAAAKRIQTETGADVRTWVADVTKAGESKRVIDACVAHYGTRRLDVLVNNGPGPKPGPSLSVVDQDWQAGFEAIVLSNVRACTAAYPHLKGGGSIVNVVSTSVKEPIDQLVLSNSLRMAVVGFAKTLSLEWARDQIRINNVCPGSIATRRIEEIVQNVAKRENITVADARARREKGIPAGRFGTIHEVGEAIAFLASPKAAYITGQTLSVDGGATRWTFG